MTAARPLLAAALPIVAAGMRTRARSGQLSTGPLWWRWQYPTATQMPRFSASARSTLGTTAWDSAPTRWLLAAIASDTSSTLMQCSTTAKVTVDAVLHFCGYDVVLNQIWCDEANVPHFAHDSCQKSNPKALISAQQWQGLVLWGPPLPSWRCQCYVDSGTLPVIKT